MIDIKAPTLPESITDAEVVAIHKNVGDTVLTGDLLFELETDKVILDVNSEEDGIITSILVSEGDVITEKQPLLATLMPQEVDANTSKSTQKAAAEVKIEQKLAGPAARQALRDNDLSRDDVTGTGNDGRILKEDVINQSAQSTQSTQPTQNTQNTPVSTNLQGRIEERVPMSRLRKTVAKRLLSATQETAMLTTFNEVDMTNIINIRKKYQDAFVKENQVKLGFMSLFIKASVEALKKFPAINAFIDGEETVYHGYCDVSVAISSDRGLVVPVIRNAHQMSLADIENQIIEFANKAKKGKLDMSEMMGGTFTITNGGVFGSLLSTPIINPPQSAVLGMHLIKKRPIVINDEIVARDMMYLALSYDHRIVDGRDAVLFLNHIKDILEDPARFMLGV